MCNKCKSSNTTYHLLYWQAEWFKRFLYTWWHIINRRAYYRWRAKQQFNNVLRIPIDEGMRFEMEDLFGDR